MRQPFIEKIPSLVQGISRQAPTVRFPGQVADATNVSFSVVDGARKRRGTTLIKKLSQGNANTAYRIHAIERDKNEEYAVIYGGGLLTIVDINTGNQNSPAQPGYVSGGTISNRRFETIADSTFVLNTEAIPTCPDTGEQIYNQNMPHLMTRDSYSSSGFSFSISQIDFDQRSRHRQIIKRRTGTNWAYLTYTPANGSPSTSLPLLYDMGSHYVQKALQGNGKEARDTMDILHETITYSFSSSVSVDGVTSSTGNQTAYPSYPSGMGNDPPSQYQFVQTDPYPNTIWSRVCEGMSPNGEGGGPFPWGKVIVNGGPLNKADTVVLFSPDLTIDGILSVNGTTVEIGDNDTDPPPPFVMDPITKLPVGKPISDISSIRNRLVLSTGEYLCFSSIDNFYNFYLEEPPTLTDADPIIAQLAADDICNVDFIFPFRGTLFVLTGSGQQFELSSSDVLSPTSISVTPSTRYETQPVRPRSIGDKLYMVGSGNDFSTLLEYYHVRDAVSNTATNLTSHVDNLLPKTVTGLATAPNQEMVFVLPQSQADQTEYTITSDADATAGGDSGVGDFNVAANWDSDTVPSRWSNIILNHDLEMLGEDQLNNAEPVVSVDQSKIYVYRSHTVGNERQQSAWAVWDFGDDRIQDVAVYDDTLVILRFSVDEGSLVLDKMNLSEVPDVPDNSAFKFEPCLDHMTYFATPTGSSGSAESGYTATFTTVDSKVDSVVFEDGTEYALSFSSGTATATGIVANPAALKSYIGRRVNATLELNTAFLRDDGNRPMTEGRTQLSKCVVSHRRSGDYNITVTSEQLGTSRTVDFTRPDVTKLDQGEHTAWCHGKNDEVTITLKSQNAQPVTWIGTEVHGNYYTELQ